MRLDIFLPFLRKAKKGTTPSPPALPIRLARLVLPAALFADRTKGRPAVIRRVLKRCGPTWLSAPLRRAIQAICFVVFLVLFFYVCWPYDAQPRTAQTWPGWIPSEGGIDPVTGLAQGTLNKAPSEPFAKGTILHVIDESIEEKESQYLGPYRVVGADGTTLQLEPAEPIDAELLEFISTSGGPWTLSDLAPDHWPSHYADNLAEKERLAAESFLVIDPLVSLSTALAARSWVWSLACAGGILLVCVVIPRGFCGYLCPLGTLIDMFDWAVAGRIKRFNVPDDGWWVHIKYYLLLGTLVASMFGVLLSGFVAAIPIITRGLLFALGPLHVGTLRDWHQVPPMNAGHVVSLVLFAAVLLLGFLKPRFWCKYVCPSGAVFSLGNLFRITERKVDSTCINCNKCVEICPFDAIKPDFTTRTTDCTECQTCGGVCPTQAITFVGRWNTVELKVENDPPTGETAIGRRGFLAASVGIAAGVGLGGAAALATKAFGARLDDPDAPRPVRPPGSVPEREFLELCIRCGECFKACPNDVLQAQGFQQGLEGIWTPRVEADWAGCESSCNACGQVCPTGAIRALPLEEKKVARMGLAIVNHQTCLPHSEKEACQLCVDECVSAGYNAIEFTQVGTEVDDFGLPVEGTGFVAPVVLAEKCVGCGLCQTRCHAVLVKTRGVLEESAIIIEAGEGKEDRLMTGSYIRLREAEARERKAAQKKLLEEVGDEGYLPDDLKGLDFFEEGEEP